MSFLTVNGWAIPIADGSASEGHDIGGSFKTSINGSRFSDEQFDKRVWKGTTPPLSEMVAEAVKGAVRGLGHVWSFSDSLYSSKGLGPTGSTSGLIVPGESAIGALDVSDQLTASAGSTGAKYGAGALRPQGAITNILAANQRDVEGDTTGFTAQGAATIAVSTTEAMEGSQSLSVTGMAAGTDGVRVNAFAVTAGDSYIFSVYLQSGSLLGGSVDLEAVGDVAGSLASVTAQALLFGDWIRLDLAFTAGGSDSTVYVDITRNATIISMWADMIQVHSTTASTRGARVSEGWVDGTGAAVDLEYNPSFIEGSAGLTINAWVRVDTGDTGYKYLVAIEKTNGFLAASLAVNGATLRGLSGAAQVTGTVTTGWKMATYVIRPNAETGENKAELYIDGASVATSAGTPSSIAGLSSIYVGHNAGADIPDALIDDLVILPYAATADQITAWFGMSNAMPGLSKYYVGGDSMPDDAETILAEGDARASTYVAGFKDGVFRENMRRVTVEVREV